MSAPALSLDLVITEVTLITADPAQPLLRDAALGVAGDRIAWIGAATDAPSAKEIQRLPGRVVTPGLVNTHTHSAFTMVRGVAADLGFAPSYTKGIPNALDLTPEDAIALARQGALEAMLFGSTLIGEHFVHMEHCLPELAKLGLRVHASVRLHDVDFRKVAEGAWEYEAKLGDALLATNLDMHSAWHGEEDGRVAVQFAAHAADTCSDAFLRRVAAVAKPRNAIVNTHLAQSKVELERVRARNGRSPVETFAEAGLLDDKLLCGHCIYVDTADIARMAEAGVHVVHIPKCNAASGRLAPTPDMQAAGLNMTLATDTQHGDMIELMRWALATARIRNGRIDDTWQPEQVFDMATINGARALGLGDEIGSLAVGKKADFVVVDFRRAHLMPAPDPLGNLVHTGMGRDVEHVFVDGRAIVRDGRAALVDQEAILAEATRVAQKLWRNAA